MRPLAHRVSRIHVSPIRRVARLFDEARERSDIISFAGGAPSVSLPQGLLDEFARLLSTDPLRSCGYTGTRGIPQLREAIAADMEKYGKVHYDSNTEVILSTGGTEAISSILMSILNPGDEVIVTDPTYLGYREMIELAEGRPEMIPVKVEEGYQPSVENLKGLVSNKTKVAIIISPDNPTGRIVSEAFAKALVDLAEDYDFWIISDEVYKHIIYEGEHVWMSRLPGAREHTITVGSFSKEASIPGLRLGYTLAPEEVINGMEKIQQYSTLAPDSLAQFALVKFLDGNLKEPYLREIVIPFYLKKRNVMGRMLQAHLPEAKTITPPGAFYYFVDMRYYLARLGLDEEEFASQLLEEKGVAVIPGRFFGDNGVGHVRLTFVSEPEERIEDGIRKIGEFTSSAKH